MAEPPDQAALPPPQFVEWTDPGGGPPQAIPYDQALYQQSIGQGHLATTEEISLAEAASRRAEHQATINEEFAGVGGGLRAGLEAPAFGVVRGLSAGLSDPAIIEGARLLGGDRTAEIARRRLELDKDMSPLPSFAGEASGMALGLLAGPSEAGLAARLATPAGAIGTLGRGVEAGLGGGRVGRLAAASVENALFAAGQQASDDALGNNKALVGEKYVVALGHGALFGAGFGAFGELFHGRAPNVVLSREGAVRGPGAVVGEVRAPGIEGPGLTPIGERGMVVGGTGGTSPLPRPHGAMPTVDVGRSFVNAGVEHAIRIPARMRPWLEREFPGGASELFVEGANQFYRATGRNIFEEAGLLERTGDVLRRMGTVTREFAEREYPRIIEALDAQGVRGPSPEAIHTAILDLRKPYENATGGPKTGFEREWNVFTERARQIASDTDFARPVLVNAAEIEDHAARVAARADLIGGANAARHAQDLVHAEQEAATAAARAARAREALATEQAAVDAARVASEGAASGEARAAADALRAHDARAPDVEGPRAAFEAAATDLRRVEAGALGRQHLADAQAAVAADIQPALEMATTRVRDARAVYDATLDAEAAGRVPFADVERARVRLAAEERALAEVHARLLPGAGGQTAARRLGDVAVELTGNIRREEQEALNQAGEHLFGRSSPTAAEWHAMFDPGTVTAERADSAFLWATEERARRVARGERVGGYPIERAVPGRYSLMFDSVRASGQAVVLGASIRAPSGEMVGSILRTFSRRARGDLHVHHDFFQLAPAARGVGIAKSIIENSFRDYKRLGVSSVSVDAALEDGRWMWAHFGFKWPKRENAEWMRRLERFLIEKREYTTEAARELAASTGGDGKAIADLGDRIGWDFLHDRTYAPSWHGERKVQPVAEARRVAGEMRAREPAGIEPEIRPSAEDPTRAREAYADAERRFQEANAAHDAWSTERHVLESRVADAQGAAARGPAAPTRSAQARLQRATEAAERAARTAERLRASLAQRRARFADVPGPPPREVWSTEWQPTMSLKRAHEIQSAYQREAFADRDRARSGALRRVSNVFEDYMQEAGDRASGSFVQDYQRAQHMWFVGKTFEELGEAKLRQPGSSLLGWLSRTAGRGLAGGLLGGMPGAALGAIGGGAAAGAASGRGGLLAVQAALGAADLIGVKQTLNRLDRNVARATARVARIRGADDGPVPSLGLRPQPMGVAPSRGPGRYGRHFDTIVDRVEELQANPAEATMRVTQALEPLARVSPEAGTAASLTALKGLAYLASRLPSSRTDPYSLTPGAAPKRRPISGLERAAFLRSAEAVNDPLVVLAHAEKGTLSREHVEAVKAVYPETFAELRAQVLTATMQRTTPLPYATRVQIGLLMDGPTDPTMTPAFLRAAASNYSAPAPEHPPGQQKEINVPLRLADSTQTMFGGDGVARRR